MSNMLHVQKQDHAQAFTPMTMIRTDADRPSSAAMPARNAALHRPVP